MKRSFCISVFLFFYVATNAQSISSAEAKTLANSLADRKQDAVQITTLLKLAKYQVFKPGENKIDLDSAASFIKKAEDVNAITNSKWADGYILLIKSYWLKESNQRDTAKAVAWQAVRILKNEADKDLAGEAYMELSSYFDFNDAESLTQRIELVRLAVNAYAQSGNIQLKAASLQMLGDLYNIKGSSYIALQHLQASLDAYDSIRYPQVQGIYCLMGMIYARQREYPRALEMELLALKTAESTGDSSMQLCEIYNYLGEIQMGLSEREVAIFYYEKALEVAKKHMDAFAIYLASVNIANAWNALKKPNKALDIMKNISLDYTKPQSYNLDNNIARCYIGSYSLLGQFEKARPYANQLLDQVNTPNLNDKAKISNYTVAIKFFITAGDDEEASKFIEVHSDLAKKLNDLYYLAANQKLRFMLDTSRHHYKAAVIHLLESSRLNDSLSIQTKSRQIAELQVQFETEKKENAIVAKDLDIQLLTRQSQLQQTRIEKGRLMRNFMIAGAGLLLLILALVYRGYRIKKRNNRILNEQRTQINEQNSTLQAMVHEKEWLLKEIHHRVKNNLQIVMSLLNSQSAYIDNESALTAIHDSQHRVHAMSLIHQKLYNSENLSSINMSSYIRELVSYLRDSFDTGSRIRFEFDTVHLELDVSQAVPLGLILNEAITNSIKYAFPKERTGVISISLYSTSPNHYLLSIADNGIGIPPHLDHKKPGSLGMSLMAGLSEDLDGNFTIENNHGTTVKISFLHDLGVKRSDTAAALVDSINHD